MWSYAGRKKCRWWVGVARDARTRPVVAMAAGRRDEFTARCLWDALPDGDRDSALACTDFRAAYRAVGPADRPAAAGKDAGRTNHLERFWATVRARCARPVRKTRSSSTCEWNHVGSLWFFTRQYNACRL